MIYVPPVSAERQNVLITKSVHIEIFASKLLKGRLFKKITYRTANTSSVSTCEIKTLSRQGVLFDPVKHFISFNLIIMQNLFTVSQVDRVRLCRGLKVLERLVLRFP